jgi:hypothetical protein
VSHGSCDGEAGTLLRLLLFGSLSWVVAQAISAFGQTLPPGIALTPGTSMHRFQAGEPDASGDGPAIRHSLLPFAED